MPYPHAPAAPLAALAQTALAALQDVVTTGVPRETPDDARARQLAELARTHRAVVAALAVVLGSGALLALADVEVYATSAVYWTKMALVAALLANGFLMTRAERAAERAGGVADTEARWGRLRAHALLSVALWFATLLAGTTLGNV